MVNRIHITIRKIRPRMVQPKRNQLLLTMARRTANNKPMQRMPTSKTILSKRSTKQIWRNNDTIIKLTILNWRFTFSMAPITKIVGVNSLLDDGNHILMWDFDDTTLNQVAEDLLVIQDVFELPRIYLLETKKDKSFIAYCFKRLPWRKIIEIITATKGVDYNFIKYGIYREKLTLRVTAKCGRKPKLVWIFESHIPEDAKVKDLRKWVQYETLSDNFKQQKVELTIGMGGDK